MMVAVVAAIVFVERGHRRVTVQYAKRLVGRRMYGGSSTHIPLKVNTGGVIPVIFASSMLAFPATLAGVVPGRVGAGDHRPARRTACRCTTCCTSRCIIFFAYFYTAIIFNPDDVAENMRKYGGFVPGIRPGKRTAEYIDTILARITLAGAIYLAADRDSARVPDHRVQGGADSVRRRVARRRAAAVRHGGHGREFYFGGTSLLIVVGVAMDTVQQIESS